MKPHRWEMVIPVNPRISSYFIIFHPKIRKGEFFPENPEVFLVYHSFNMLESLLMVAARPIQHIEHGGVGHWAKL